MLAGASERVCCERRFGAMVQLPWVHGAARLGALAYEGRPLTALLALIGPAPGELRPTDLAGWLLDVSLAHALCFRPQQATCLQREALTLAQAYRVRGGGAADGPRVLVLMAPGDLMANAPIDFLTTATNLQLTLLYVCPGVPLPDRLPEHDVAIVAASQSEPAALLRLGALFDAWPRPILNDPRRIAALSRDGVALRLLDRPGLASPASVQASRGCLLADGAALLPDGRYPVLLRPLHSHAGDGLVKCDRPADIAGFLAATRGDLFYLTQFVDYRGRDGWFRKYRVAFIEGRPFLCHMAASEWWMVHYLNAGMAESAAKRGAEADAMAEFDHGFARRHRTALAAVADAIGLDYFSIDCTELADGRLLVFEADVAAIIHFMDPPALYPYKHAPMQLCADAFAAMVGRRC